MTTLPDLLRWAGAPDGLTQWADESPQSELELLQLPKAELSALLERCPRAGWTAWLAAAATIPMDLVVAAVGVAIEAQAGDAGLTTLLEEAYAAVTGEGSGEACLTAADRCDVLASEPPRTFRGDGARMAKLAGATAWVLRSAEAVSAVMAREEADRMSRVRAQTARFGGGMSAWVSSSTPPTVLAMRALSLDGEPAAPPPELAFAAEALGEALELVAEIAGQAEVRRAFLDAL